MIRRPRFFARVLSRFLGARDGHAGIMFSIMAFPLFLAVGFAMDFTQASRHKTDLQNIADAVALTAVRALPISELKAREDGTNYYEAAMESLRGGLITDGLTLRFEENPDFKAIVEITATAKGTFGNNIGLGTLRFEVDAAAILKRSASEVALVLDYSGSMTTNRLDALGRGVDLFKTTLDSMTANDTRARLAVVPFAHSVSLPANIGSDWLRTKADQDLAAGYGRVCLEPKGRAHDISSDAQAIGSFDLQPNMNRYCLEQTTTPLTANRNVLDNHISYMRNPPAFRRSSKNSRYTPYMGTSLYLGATWAMRLLDPEFAASLPPASRPDSPNNASKFAILMTDGNQIYTPYGVAQANAMLKTVCQDMKRKGITIFSVAFRAPSEAKTLLKDCAASDAHFIDATTEGALTTAFQSIASSIGEPTPRLIK